MIRILVKTDRILGALRPAFIGFGQLAVVVLGVHLAADRFDDAFHALLVWINLPWGSPDVWAVVAAWAAIGLELAVVVYALTAIIFTSHTPEITRKSWWEKRSVKAFVLPFFWAPVALAGSWVTGMAVEDVVAPVDETAALILGWTVAVVVAWRLGYSGLIRVLGALDKPKKWTSGAVFAPILVAVASVVIVHGLPIWGWLP